MHTCCAPCSVYCIDELRKEGIEPVLFWYNPNIHPYKEYEARRDCLKIYSKKINIDAIFEDEYGLDEFCKNVSGDINSRCINYCYPVRLRRTFEYAKEHGYTHVTTTLLYSIYQKHEYIKKLMEQYSKEFGIEFLYRDFRCGFLIGHKKAIEEGLYMQKYCGCIFSEEDRYYNRKKNAQKRQLLENKEVERRIRLGWSIPNLAIRKFKKENNEDNEFIYNVKKQVYQKYVEENYGQWDERAQRKLFSKFISENSKYINIIVLDGKNIGFYNEKKIDDNTYELGNICIIPEYQNKGIEKAILEEKIFRQNGCINPKNMVK